MRTIQGSAAVPPVLADLVQFEQVLNLCLNARDATGEHGTIRLRIVHAPAWGHCASCSVRLDGASEQARRPTTAAA